MLLSNVGFLNVLLTVLETMLQLMVTQIVFIKYVVITECRLIIY